MKTLLIIILVLMGINSSAQEIVWDQGIPFCPDDEYITSLIEKVDILKIRDSKDYDLTPEEKSICVEIGLAFYAKREYEVSNWYLNKVVDWTNHPIESKVSADREYVYLIKEVPVEKKEEQTESETAEMKKDLKFLNAIPKTFEKLSKNDLNNLKSQLQNQIDELIREKDSLIRIEASKQVIDSKDGVIKTLKKETEIIDLTIQKGSLKQEKQNLININKDLDIERTELKKYLLWAIIGLSILILIIIAILQRKIIKVKDGKIDKQFRDIVKKNTYLEHAAKIIRHDMHSGINTYIPRGLSSLEKKLSEQDIKSLKLETSIKMIKEGLNHTQRVYKNVYEFTNLVKTKAVLEKKRINLKDLLIEYLSTTSYSSNVNIGELVDADVNDYLFCNAIDMLIKNGLKYNKSDEKKIEIYMNNNILIVEDNGVGLSEKQFNKIIEKTNINEEDGLGINISSAILQEHGFQLTCEQVENGTKMKIKLK
jgi:signal transduction histidine kinase